MTTTFATNADNNDLFLDASGSLVILSGLPAVSATCATATKAQLGEMVLASQLGMPNFKLLWIGVPNIALYETYLRNTLESVSGVRGVSSITARIQDSAFIYDAVIQTNVGSVTLHG